MKTIACPGVFDGWEQYPSNLPDFDALCENGSGYDERLQSMAGSLFSTRVALQVIDANSQSSKSQVTPGGR